MTPRRTPTIKDIATIASLSQGGQLILSTEFQRDSVWPTAAKAYLLDTILSNRPVPYLYFRRAISAQSGRSQYEVIDGQQRIRAILEFLNDGFALSQSKAKGLKGQYFSDLTLAKKTELLSYDLYIEELTNYSDADIRDMFVRMNRYVVKLSPQEIRHAKFSGKFKLFTEELGKLPFWKTHKVFTELQLRRMRAVEFCAELIVLLVEGPQDKKAVLDLYYGQYEKAVPFRSSVKARLDHHLHWIQTALPRLKSSRFRKPTDLYALVGALERLNVGRSSRAPVPKQAGKSLEDFEKLTMRSEPTGAAARYLAAASQQTDNIAPRNTRIEILTEVLSAS